MPRFFAVQCHADLQKERFGKKLDSIGLGDSLLSTSKMQCKRHRRQAGVGTAISWQTATSGTCVMRRQRVRVLATLCHSSLIVLSMIRPRSSASTQMLLLVTFSFLELSMQIAKCSKGRLKHACQSFKIAGGLYEGQLTCGVLCKLVYGCFHLVLLFPQALQIRISALTGCFHRVDNQGFLTCNLPHNLLQ